MSDSTRLTAAHVAGLQNDVTISVDQWGIAHIRAENLHDLFFAQGWNAARDRLWQIDIARKRGLGLLARDFGPGYLEQDKAARLLLYRGDMASEWKAYGPDSEEICTAFAKGINAYVDACNSGEIPLPPEFTLLGHEPDRWKPEDVVRVRTHSLTRNASSELLRSKVMAIAGVELGAELDMLRKELSYGVVPEPVDGFDPSVMTDRVLRDFQLAVSPATFSKERLVATLDEADQWTIISSSGEIVRASFEEGSNNWAISAEKTTTGRPILALDPHRTHVLPSIRYIVHLTMPGLDLIGAGEPMVPGISMGHNGTAAFGLTIFGADQEDIYVYQTDKSDPDQYAYLDGSETFRTITETIPVKGYPDQTADLKFTRHGPVLYEDHENNRAFGLRTVWMDAGMAPYMASLSVMRAATYADYASALKGWGCPSVNHIYADTTNTIAWKPSGATPVRNNWDGLLPVPGDGRYEWQGYLSTETGPHEINPSRGFVATANAMNVPDDWTASNPAIGYEWLDSSRHDTLHRELSRQELISLEDCARLQCSTFSPIAARVLKCLSALLTSDVEAAPWRLLQNWDGNLSANSAAAALFEIWFSKHLGLLAARSQGAVPEVIPLLVPFDAPSIASWLQNSAPTAEHIDAVRQSLVDAWAETVSLMGTDSEKWAWGSIHQLTLRHPLQSLTNHNWSMEPVALGGSSSTLNYANYRLSDFSIVVGPSVRMVIDVGAWDNSLFVNNPGQSGVPLSRHYSDLLENWREGKHVPLLYSKERVDEATVTKIMLSAG
ncbi:penicillin acylase family protein [Ochrobactrum quorumnocens]|jgi:penicillin amidase|uniref:Penicillin acylase family protein n=1 Tax=Ochrobactrum quorumnocens TaxID=271865 RepID=A0A5N1JU82_9HYPH|nr:penicillin acylase family protein [[Ochrobactrum] quorumnocens]KAA9366930.1 penicillin acylase family protein [[Ochrobactrum] quorumnocens]